EIDEIEFKKKHQWINELKEIRDLYVQSLTDLRKLNHSNEIIAQNPILAEGFDKIGAIFQALGDLHDRTHTITSDFDAFILAVQKKKIDLANDIYENLKEQLIRDIKPFVEQTFQMKNLLNQSITDLKLSDIIHLDKVSLNDKLLQELDGKLAIEEGLEQSSWNVERVATSDDEEALQFTYSEDPSVLNFNPRGYLLLDLEFKGALQGKSQSMNVELRYPNTTFFRQEVEEQVTEKFSKTILNLIHYGSSGLPAPIKLSVVEGQQILGNGAYQNEIKLVLTNIGRESIGFGENAEMQLSFEVQREGKVRAAALVEKSNVSTVRIRLMHEQNLFSTKEQTIHQVYRFGLQRQKPLLPNTAITIIISGVKTAIAPGFAIIDVNLVNLEEYRDTEQSVMVQRVAHLQHRGQGIFTVGAKDDNLRISHQHTKIDGGAYSIELDDKQGFQLKKGKKALLHITDKTPAVAQLPIGSIILWHGDANHVPDGWQICDGSTYRIGDMAFSTPNLQGRFVVGVGPYQENRGNTGLAKIYKLDEQGGSSEEVLSSSHLPKHTHKVEGHTGNDGDHEHYWRGHHIATKAWTGQERQLTAKGYNSGQDPHKVAYKGGKHKHKIDLTTSSVGRSAPHNNLPPYYALHYIIRIK
ncbi:MAG: hypothetical protein ACPGJS_24110, partial [Flammeovirgaceae bacterium]